MSDEKGIVLAGHDDSELGFEPIRQRALSLIDEIKNRDDAERVVRDVKSLEHMLKAKDLFDKYICEFCEIEAMMWFNIAKHLKSGARFTRFKQSEKNLVEWMLSLNDYDRQKVMAECVDGRRIMDVKKDMESASSRHSREREYERITRKIEREAETQGYTTLNSARFNSEWESDVRPSKGMEQAYTERTRDRLLSKGLASLGDGTGTYMSPERTNVAEKSQILASLLSNAEKCIDSIGEWCEKLGVGLSDSQLRMLMSKVARLGQRRSGAS